MKMNEVATEYIPQSLELLTRVEQNTVVNLKTARTKKLLKC